MLTNDECLEFLLFPTNSVRARKKRNCSVIATRNKVIGRRRRQGNEMSFKYIILYGYLVLYFTHKSWAFKRNKTNDKLYFL